MKNKPTREPKTLWEKLTAPFRVLSVEKFYWFWVVSYFISFAGLLIDLLNHNFSNSINNGMVFSTCMAIFPPVFIEFISNYIYMNRKKSKEEYSIYKGWTMGICIVILILLFLFYVTEIKSSWIAQLICFVVVFFALFYTYLVTKMEVHNTVFEDFKDKPYLEAEKEVLSKTRSRAKKLKTTTTAEGVEIKL